MQESDTSRVRRWQFPEKTGGMFQRLLFLLEIKNFSNMKHNQLITLLLFFAVAAPSSAQYFERSFQTDFYNSLEAMRWGENGELNCITKGGDQSDFQPLFLRHFDDQGNETHFPIASYGMPLDYDWLALQDGYLVTGYFFECDIILPRRYFYFDKSGTLLWEKETDPSEPTAYSDIKLLPGPANTFWAFRGDKPVQYDLDSGDSIGVASLPLPLFDGYVTTAGGNLLTYGSGLTLYNPALTFFQFGLQGTYVLKADALPDGRFAALTSEKLYLLNSDLGIAKEIDHGIQINANVRTDLAAGASGIWLLATTEPRQLLHYDTALTLLETKTVPSDAPFQPVLVAADADRVVLAGEEYGLPFNQVVSLRSTSAANIFFDATPDAALTDVTSVHPPVGYFYPAWYEHEIVFDSVAVTLKNEGGSVLDEVTLNTVLGYYNFICHVTYTYRQKFTGLNLLPGNSMTLELGEIEQYGQFNVPATTTLCFWTTLPNDSLDQFRPNNSICKTFNVTVAVSDPKETKPLEIYPNPAMDAALIKVPDEPIAFARLYDMTGRLLLNTRISGNEWTLQRADLPAGMYQIIIAGENGQVYSGKIVFE